MREQYEDAIWEFFKKHVATAINSFQIERKTAHGITKEKVEGFLRQAIEDESSNTVYMNNNNIVN